ncbi:2-hydroxychromene-2-carboxylate isomerase [Labrys monachus]|uniref:2-hydroxychromene-2-carboxylate isomerase n=1 Tax=Labrys monachus TaxID=217067 RepID=A0ABU0FD97_9HYPH|nr:2-hydroxychromene-2-carboxylate isomerase [Labrys monachus]MDQ0392572.1 2-hydroxychromene-2-carboxylate isomerase [Labrys monachus]
MTQHLDYYFSLSSPWAYIGHARLMEIAGRHGLAISCKPVQLGEVFAETGGLPLARRHPVRQRYRSLELQRWRARLGLDFHLQPKYWPFDVALADRFVIAVEAGGADTGAFLARAFPAVWEQERDLADEAVLLELAREAGLDGEALLPLARSEAAAQAYERNRADALSSDVFGSPSYVLGGEVFWGQDRLELLDDALCSGRAPYRPAV